jgi:hypothetical protein
MPRGRGADGGAPPPRLTLGTSPDSQGKIRKHPCFPAKVPSDTDLQVDFPRIS